MNLTASTAPFGFRRDLHRWRQLVTPAWLAGLVAGAPLTAAPDGEWRLFEVGFGAADAFERAHIPGAGYIDTAQLEHGPLWNKVPDPELKRLLLAHGIRHDVTVVLYGRNTLAAARAAHLLLYAGVADVRLLDGGFDAWKAAGHAMEEGPARRYRAAAGFGAAFPGRPDYLVDMPQARRLLERPDGALVSIRTWNEFIGKTSGYSYIDARGDIPGACWGRAGVDDDVNSMAEFHRSDGHMKPSAEISHMWQAAGVHAGHHTAFYCGTGWRASLAFFYAWLMNWERIAVYDGGWCEWSRDAGNPVVCRVAATPPSHPRAAPRRAAAVPGCC
ncbi:sulfurtransferase [Massilia cavernae]|uniref:sulfurtransferase n=1 Tax=Massilia cavernae TaxID=2320864 RepID=UPI001E5414CE|nr:rhodanese-like domain-containing protein [Massilia cavernae]